MIEWDAISALPSQLGLSLVREHCHLDSFSPPGTLDDALLTVYIKAAVRWFEGETQRSMIARPHRWTFREFPYTVDQRLYLPRGKTQSVNLITYSTGHNLFTLTGPSASPAGSGFQEDLRGDAGGFIMPRVAASWPYVDADVPTPILLEFTAGWADGSVPDDVIQACCFFVADCVELRGTLDMSSALVRAGANLRTREFMISGYALRGLTASSNMWITPRIY